MELQEKRIVTLYEVSVLVPTLQFFHFYGYSEMFTSNFTFKHAWLCFCYEFYKGL